jgi:hypothetical protein
MISAGLSHDGCVLTSRVRSSTASTRTTLTTAKIHSEHGLLPGTRRASLPQAEDAPIATQPSRGCVVNSAGGPAGGSGDDFDKVLFLTRGVATNAGLATWFGARAAEPAPGEKRNASWGRAVLGKAGAGIG